MDLYGISSFDMDFVSTKINYQKDYLYSQNFITSSGSVKSLMDVSMSANLSARYYAQLVNKVNTLQQVMTNQDLTPVFLTLTLDGVYHDLLYGDYSRFTLFHQKNSLKMIQMENLKPNLLTVKLLLLTIYIKFCVLNGLRFKFHLFTKQF